MKNNSKIVINLILYILFGISQGYAAVPTVKAKLDSTQILMGQVTKLHLEVTQEKGRPGGFPIFSGDNRKGYVGVCGDSIELRSDYRRDTVEIGSGKIQINYEIPVQSFDSGFYQLPQFVYISGTDSAKSNVVSLKVIPVAVTADAKISDFAPPADPEGGNIFDYLPNWMVDYWWILLLIALIAILVILAVRRYKSKGFILPKKPDPLPYDVAMSELKKLKSLNLWEQGMEKEYFTRLTDILRIYLDKRFSINAVEMTTPEILTKLSENPAIKDKKEYIRRILDTADFVKFAKVRPLPEDNIAAFDTAKKFVEETRPTQEEIAAYKEALANSESPIGTNIKTGKSAKSTEESVKESKPLKLAKKITKIRKKGGSR
ncbi:MAG: cell wall anchor protein [Prevotella sp.]|nr:cell wall anchor protein [Bacteroides sp.]MCM1366618.1 cell wall anchor protein [Prevotella sp.]MCM1436983.1 cell wall anchor protein [Prevotella sp.]